MSEPYALFSEPGTFHIASKECSHVIAVPEYDKNRAVANRWTDTPDQHWFIQQSGRGYTIKNYKYGVYLAASSNQVGAVVGTSETPTIWTIMKTHDGFLIQYDEDNCIDIQYRSWDNDKILDLWPSSNCPESRRWSFERISDKTGEEKVDITDDEVNQLKHELAPKIEQLELKDQEIAKKNQQLAEQVELASRRGSMREMNNSLKSFIGRWTNYWRYELIEYVLMPG